MSRAAWSRAGLIALGALVAAAVGAGGAVALLAPVVPPTLGRADPAESAPVSFQPFADERTVDVAVTPSPDIPFAAPVAGRITRWECEPGTTFVSGRSALSIDGAAILGLATEVPLWRELRPGDSGEDVAALQEELARLGFGVAADGVLGSASIEAIRHLLSATEDGLSPATEAVDVRRLIWLPRADAEVTDCPASLGAAVAADEPLATIAARPTAVEVARLPEDLLDGPRVLTVGDATVAIGEDGTVVSAEDRAVIGAAARARSEAGENGGPSITGTIALVTPVSAASVPPSAVYRLIGSEGCVLSGARAHAVRVVGSQLGQSFVVFGDGEAPESVTVRPGKEARACR